MESDPMKRYSIFSLVGNALSGHQNWPLAWRNTSPKKQYDVVIIGGGGHGLATAYYLAKEHGLRNVAVLEKGWLGGGNTGRNTTIVRSNYHLEPNAHFYDLSLKLWERLSQALNFNVMYSARGVLNLVHTPAEIDAAMRRGNAMRLNGIDAQFLSREEIATRIPNLDCSPNARFPIVGGLLQPHGGTVRHDAVAWGYARAADSLGVDIIQRCEVTGIRIERKAVSGVVSELRAAAPDAHVGRHHGHDDGRQPDHRQIAGVGPLHDRWLVLRRLQGDAGIRICACMDDRARRAASAQRRVHARAFWRGSHDRRKGRRPLSVGALMRVDCP